MALWLFRRKSRRKHARSNTLGSEDTRGRSTQPTLPPRSQTAPDVAMAMLAPALGSQETKEQRTEPNRLQRRARPYSFSPDRQDSIWVRRTKSSRTKKQTANAPSFEDQDMMRVPTLHNKRDGEDLSGKKSSKKRRKHDPQREAEIKAMSAFAPVRPAAEDWSAGRPMKRESKRIKTGLGFGGFKGSDWDKRNRSSDISLPVPESIDSALSSDSDFMSFKVSALEALAPRPTLRCTSRFAADGSALLRRPSQRDRKSPSAPIPEATLKAHKRVANLADDLTASDLRELMERDQRRRERKLQRDQEKIEQRLARRAEKQKAVDAAARKEGRESPPNLERGVLGRESVGSGIDTTSAVITSSRIRTSAEAPKPNVDGSEAVADETRPHPLDTFHRVDSIPPPTPQTNLESSQQLESILTSARSRSSILRPMARHSKSPRDSIARTEQSESLRKVSESSSSKGPVSWASFFRWGIKNKTSSEGPSSFSNTSRDSMQTGPQVPTPPTNFVPRRLSSGVPKRTMSRFREDLPELPMSPPPDSQLHSPVDPIPPIEETSPDIPAANEEPAATPSSSADGPQTSAYDHQALEAMRGTPSTFSHADEHRLSPEPKNMSLASIDSEASWFSGKASKKRKTSGMARRLTPESDNERIDEVDHPHEDMFIAEDDYLSRLAPSQGGGPSWNRRSNGDPRPSSDWEDEAHWGVVKGQQPTVVHAHTVDRMKSREGLLNTFGDQDEENPAGHEEVGESTDGSSPIDEGADIQRATSVDLGKAKARHMSAGSVRLLSISPRSSVDAKRASLASKTEVQ
ncbi:hypothetical protein QBC42DRAFT_108351 [Cladorrhinum samala]|uniref:Uncharacterized protein n=1 Tax=Cladorrhinum samala TaxID=585594 RepID=A0AAV9I1X4_9PEZI|nr:hypothetical protein QBC42DRAFT_108351 [Cladorrhinum samala]